ncbi:peptidyl-tRNA hydrolase, mitochondrial isoform X1 [Cucumis melo]|uniref:Peptidyl-tRNA hydrolase, mitochondrial isoform X1 n=2 Tax=Cucumis melo TaxID=3656 RepID=A0A9I9DAT5_CUCME|nr:peptidyl-tRNA hydrolase, mitochondrial isoform X1 [Cucumis melo]
MFNKLTKRGFCTAISSRPWLFVGLGNPGEKFRGTRHNVGFQMIDVFAESVGIPMNRVHCKAVFGEGFVGDIPVFLAKPQTYMNLSGESAGPLAAHYKLPLNRVLVFHDDMNLPCGVLRLQHNGGHDYHNGFSVQHARAMLIRLKSVIYHFRGNREFARLRIGIGRPPGQMDPKAFLLQKFNNTAQERIDTALQEGVGALKRLLSHGLSESVRHFNHEQKYKHIRLQTMPV